MRFTAVSVVSLLAGTAIAAPTDVNANKASDMSADASIANMRLANLFSERQMAVLRVLSEHQQELGMSQEEKDMMDAFMAALHDEAAVTVKRQALVPVPTLTALNGTALGSLGSVIGAPTGIVGAVGGAASGAANTAAGLGTDLLSILKNIPGLGALLANATGAAGGATSGLGSATSGLSGLTGGLGGLNGSLGGLTGRLGGQNGSLGGLTGGLGGLTGGLGGLCGGARRGGLLGGILIPGIL
ncbi:hypothetical protein ACHAPX_004054 [Trichoderma viride]